MFKRSVIEQLLSSPTSPSQLSNYNYQSFWNHFMKTIGWKSYLAVFCTGDYVRSIMQRNKQ